MNFSLEEIEDNANGFGPSNLPKILNSLPFAPYSKSDRIGKIADFCAPQSSQEDGHRKRHHRNTEAFGTGSALTFMYQHAAEDEATFSIVDRASTVRKPFGKSQRKTGPFKRDTLDKKGMPIQRRRFGLEKPARIREASIAISNDWTLLEEVDFSSLAKLNFEVDEPVDMYVFFYNGM